MSRSNWVLFFAVLAGFFLSACQNEDPSPPEKLAPGEVFLGADLELKVVDFAALTGLETQNDSYLGTPDLRSEFASDSFVLADEGGGESATRAPASLAREDGLGALLVIRNANEDSHLELSSPDDGIFLDLFGQARDHEMMKVSWFTNMDFAVLVKPDLYGHVEGADQMFGSLDDLRALDSNGDGVIDAQDGEFSRLRLWVDRNLDGEAEESEFVTLAAAGLTAIELQSLGGESEQDAYGNSIAPRALVRWGVERVDLLFSLRLHTSENSL